MASTILRILLALYVLYALLKFFDFFFLPYEKRIERISDGYRNDGRTIKIFDNVVLALVATLVVLLFVSGVEYLSFTTGLLVGMTLIQVYFHRFSAVLPPDKMPKPPLSAIKLMSWSIQANPEKPWLELIFMTVLLVWCLYMLVSSFL